MKCLKLVSVLLVGSYCLAGCSSGELDVHRGVVSSGSTGGLGLGGVQLFYSAVYGAKGAWTNGGRSFGLETHELELDLDDPSNPLVVSGPHYLTRNFSTAYAIDFVAARHANEIYVAGTGRGGAIILERWVFPEQNGAYYSEKETLPPLLGVPVAVEPVIVGIGESSGVGGPPGPGGNPWEPPYSAPLGRPSPPPPVRDELYRGFDIGAIASMAIDPEGRFALVRDVSSDDLYQIMFSDPATVASIFTPSQLGILNSERITITPRLHISEGRKYHLAGWDENNSLPNIQLLEDANNDGVFESVSSLYTHSGYANSAYGPLSAWLDNYRDFKYVP
jgi:hypothetical protein